jgi:hypothetical protein
MTVTILSYGMGVESTAILLRWIVEPETRPCPLKELLVISAQTGNEYSDTGRDVERYVLPLMRAHRIRFVQVARGGQREAEGVVVLSDTPEPYRVHLEGAYKLSDELERNGTVPQYSSEHRCSLKFKAWVIEQWLTANVRAPARHAFGYNADETERVARSQAALERIAFGFNRDESDRVARSMCYNTPTRTAFYPLVEWGWNRSACLEYILSKLGVVWNRSACVFCPFNALSASAIARHSEHPEEVGDALMIEHVSLALNPRATLYRDRSLIQIAIESGNRPALDMYQRKLANQRWAVYRVRRIYSRKGKADRAVQRAAVFRSPADAVEHLNGISAWLNIPIEVLRGIRYVFVEKRSENVFPCREEYFVAAPAIVEEKAHHGLAWFETKWTALQMELAS